MFATPTLGTTTNKECIPKHHQKPMRSPEFNNAAIVDHTQPFQNKGKPVVVPSILPFHKLISGLL
jgi:hypothetical protein